MDGNKWKGDIPIRNLTSGCATHTLGTAAMRRSIPLRYANLDTHTMVTDIPANLSSPFRQTKRERIVWKELTRAGFVRWLKWIRFEAFSYDCIRDDVYDVRV